CVLGQLEDLPFKDLQIKPFNLKDAERTGAFARTLFEEQKLDKEKLSPRAIIPNDSKLFAQADIDKSITHFVTSDVRCEKVFNRLNRKISLKFQIINIDVPFSEVYGIMDL